MKPPVPGEMVLYKYAEGDWRKALLIQHVDRPDEGWQEQQWKLDPQGWDSMVQGYQGLPTGWWYVMRDGQPTYWLPPEEVYIYDGSRWRRQRYNHVNYEGGAGIEDLSVPNPDEDHANYFHLVEEVYLPEGENPPTT